MIIMFVNIRGLGGKDKKMSLQGLMDVARLYIIMILETMGRFKTLIFDLERLSPRWGFVGIDTSGLSGGLFIGFSAKLMLVNRYSISSGLLTDFFSKELNRSFSILNLYGPYDGKEAF
jgi:hypothetical protein